MKASRGFFLTILCVGMAAATQAQTLPLAGESAAGRLTLFPTRMLPHVAPLPDAPTPLLPGDDAETTEASWDSSSDSEDIAAGFFEQQQEWRPLTGRERLALFGKDSYALGAFATVSIGALEGQIANKPAQWSVDGSGYTRRFASAYGQLAARNVIREGMAAASGLDPRYISCRCRGILRRSGHALKMSFLTLTHSGRMTLDVPQLAGAYGSGMISAYWYPHRFYSPLVQGVQFGHEEMGEVFAGNLLHEFSSDIKSALHLQN